MKYKKWLILIAVLFVIAVFTGMVENGMGKTDISEDWSKSDYQSADVLNMFESETAWTQASNRNNTDMVSV